jgi:hypothetical protein
MENKMTKPWSKQRQLQARIDLLESILTDEQKQYLKKLADQEWQQKLKKLSKELEEAN